MNIEAKKATVCCVVPARNESGHLKDVLRNILSVSEIDEIVTHPTSQLLYSHNYRAFAKTYNTFFFVANEVLPKNVQSV